MHDDLVAARVAANEHAFREANERIQEAADEIARDVELLPFICECPKRDCVETTRLRRNEYELVRRDGATFLVVHGHEVTSVEGVEVARLVERFDSFSLMQKIGEAGRVSRELYNREQVG